MTDPITTIIFGMLTIFLAGLTYGLTGFGFALVAVPLLMILLPPQAVVPIQLLLASLTGIVVVYEARQWVRLKQIWPLMLAGIIGIPLGTYLLTVLDTNVLKIFIGAVISLSALAFFFGFQRPIRNERLASAPIGFISGVLNGSTGMSGPPGRSELRCRARATSSLPVPLSPVIKTVARCGATLATVSKMRFIFSD